jgi:isomerase DpgB
MSRTLIENRRVFTTEINGADLLSNELILQLDHALDQAEDLGSAAIMLVHVVGPENPAVLQPWPGPIDVQLVTKWERLLRRMERTDSATITVVERACSALALELLLVADRRLATGDFFVHCATSRAEVWPGMWLYRLSRQVGEAQARKLFLDSSGIPVDRVLGLSIIDEVVDGFNGNAATRILEYAPPDDFPVRRRLMQDSFSSSFEEALGAHLAACDRALRRAFKSDFAIAHNGSPGA